MSFSLAIALIVIADVALIGGLAFVMSRASLLTPHVARRHEDAAATGTATATVATARTRRAARRTSRRPQTSAA